MLDVRDAAELAVFDAERAEGIELPGPRHDRLVVAVAAYITVAARMYWDGYPADAECGDTVWRVLQAHLDVADLPARAVNRLAQHALDLMIEQEAYARSLSCLPTS